MYKYIYIYIYPNRQPENTSISWPKRPGHLLHYPEDLLPDGAGGESKERQHQGAAPEQRGDLGPHKLQKKQVLDMFILYI